MWLGEGERCVNDGWTSRTINIVIEGFLQFGARGHTITLEVTL